VCSTSRVVHPYDDPNPVLDQRRLVGQEAFVPLMQEITPSRCVRSDLASGSLRSRQKREFARSVPPRAPCASQAGAESRPALAFVQATGVSTEHIGPEAAKKPQTSPPLPATWAAVVIRQLRHLCGGPGADCAAGAGGCCGIGPGPACNLPRRLLGVGIPQQPPSPDCAAARDDFEQERRRRCR